MAARGRKVARSGGGKSKDLVDLMPAIDICGQRFRIVRDESIKEEGLMIPSEGLIKLRCWNEDGHLIAYWRLVDTLIHEILHAIIDASGLGWQMRQRLKMKTEAWDEFEETALIRPLVPALLATLRASYMINPPPLPGRPRHRRHSHG